MRDQSKRSGSLPYRVLLVLLIGSVLALALWAYSSPAPLSARAVLLLAVGLLLIVAIALEVVFRDVTKLRERVRALERDRQE